MNSNTYDVESLRDEVSESGEFFYKVTPVNGPPSAVAFVESMPYGDFTGRYQIRSASFSGKHDWHNFSHYKRVAKLSPIALARFTSDVTYWGSYNEPWYFQLEVPPRVLWSPIPYGPIDAPDYGLGAMYNWDGLTQEFLIPEPTELPDLLSRAHGALIPQIKANLSSINSIYELKDFISLKHTALKLASAAKLLVGLKAHKAAMLSKKTPRALLEVGADSYLQYKFNLAPLYSDIQGFLKTLRAYKGQASRLVSQSEKVITRHFDVSLSYPDSVVDQSATSPARNIYGYGNVAQTMRRRTELEPVKFHVEWEYSYYYTSFQKQHAAFLAALDGFGINLNPAIIWNAIPWSFTVDWILGVGKYLDQLTVHNLEPVVYIHRALWSVKRTRNVSTSLDSGINVGLPVMTMRETAYRRNVYSPSSISSIKTSGLSFTEGSLALALGITRRPKHHSRG